MSRYSWFINIFVNLSLFAIFLNCYRTVSENHKFSAVKMPKANLKNVQTNSISSKKILSNCIETLELAKFQRDIFIFPKQHVSKSSLKSVSQ
jgi:hypothetical protein